MYRFQKGVAKGTTYETSYKELQKSVPASAKRENLAEFLDDYIPKSVRDVEEFLRTYQTNIDDISSSGESALMTASYRYDINLLKFLLQGGANPNFACKEKRNTALHVACEYERYPPCSSSNLDTVYKRVKADDTRTLNLLKILVEKGAAMLVNKDGLNPIEVAALNRKAKSVFYCVDIALVSPVEEVRALEYLGTALGIYGDHETAYKALHLAMRKRLELNVTQNESPYHEMENFFGRPKSRSLEELEAIKDDLEAIRAEAFIVGERVLPEHLKERHVYSQLALVGSYGLRFEGELKDAFATLSGCLPFEKKGLLKFGCVLSHVREGIHMLTDHLKQDEKDAQELVGLVCDILAAFVAVVQEVDYVKLKPNVDQIVDDLASIVIDVTDSCFSLKHVEEVFVPVTDILTTMWGRVPKETCTDRSKSTLLHTVYTRMIQTSFCYTVLDQMVSEILCERRKQKESVPESNRFTRLIAQILQVEDALDVNFKNGRNMLHTVMKLVSCRPHMAMDIARLLLKHGCPADHTDHSGKTARCVAQHVLDGRRDKGKRLLQELDDILDRVSGPWETLSLQDLSARAIYRHRIPYQAILPRPVWHIVEDRLDSILLKPEAFFH